MPTLLRTRVIPIWLLLMLATFVSWELFNGFGFGADRRAGNIAVIAIAFLKVRYVGLDFMEIRHAPPGLRIAFELWVLAMMTALITLYVTGLTAAR